MKQTHKLMSFIALLLTIGIILFSSSCSKVNFSHLDDSSTHSLSSPNSSTDPNQPIVIPVEPTYKTIQEVFYQQDSNSQVDILMVIDNSPSMIEEQQKMGTKISSFLSELGQIDWQIGITTTDISGGTFSTNGNLLKLNGINDRILTNKTPNYNQVFLNTITRPESNCTDTCPSTNEQPLRAAMMAMEQRDTQNQGFFRPGADLVLVIISDEDEMSNAPPQATTPQMVIDHVKSIWGNTKNFTTYAIIIRPNDYSCFMQNYGGGGTYGTYAHTLAQLTGGLEGNICDADYGPSLSQIGNRVRTLLSSFTLSFSPVSGSLHISLNPFQDISWELSGQNIRFKSAPVSGTQIDVKYLIPSP